jgi:hypothetical protein
MRLALLTAVVVGVLAASLTGCSSVPADPRAELEQRAAVLDAAAQDLLDAVSVAGFANAKARGAVDVCQSQPVPGVSYAASAQVKFGDDLRSAFDAVAAQLKTTGWRDSGHKLVGEHPSGRFTRDDVTLDVKTGGFSSGGKSYGTDEMELSLRIADPCVRIPDGSSFVDFQDLDKDILPRS